MVTARSPFWFSNGDSNGLFCIHMAKELLATPSPGRGSRLLAVLSETGRLYFCVTPSKRESRNAFRRSVRERATMTMVGSSHRAGDAVEVPSRPRATSFWF